MIFFLASAVVFPEPTLLEDSAGRLPSRGVSTRGPINQKKKSAILAQVKLSYVDGRLSSTGLLLPFLR